MSIGTSHYVMDWDLARILAEKALWVAGILVITWALAKGAKWAFAKLVNQVPFLQRQSGSGESVGESLGKIVSLLIWLLGMIAILQRLGLDNVIKPLQTLLDNIMGFIPNIIGAGVILFVGLVVARIVKQLVETTLSTVNLDGWAAKGGVEKVTGTNTISKTIATICYVLVIIPIAIAALQALKISAISDPATEVLETILSAIPLLVGASLLLGIGFFVGSWASTLLEDLLAGLGVDRTIHSTGLVSERVSPSKIIGNLAMIGIMLFLAIAATRMLNFPELTNILNSVLEIGGRVIFGSVIIGIGILIANLVASLIAKATDGGSLGPSIVRYATIGLFVAMGLSQMGIGGPIVELAFGAIVIAAAVAGALAFGLGGRDAAARALSKLENDVEKPSKK
jgi:hypothetical protein